LAQAAKLKDLGSTSSTRAVVGVGEDGAVWERMLPGGECLVLAVRESALFGKPERSEWTLVKFMKDGTPGGFAGPVTLHDALSLAIAFPVLSQRSMGRP
jgi:hypothetical protein